MKTIYKCALPVSALMLLGLSQGASATACTAEIEDAKADISLAADGFISRNSTKDIDGLLGKLTVAYYKLDEGKIEDAGKKAEGAIIKLDQLNNVDGKPKLSETLLWYDEDDDVDKITYDLVYDALSDVMDCIDGIG